MIEYLRTDERNNRDKLCKQTIVILYLGYNEKVSFLVKDTEYRRRLQQTLYQFARRHRFKIHSKAKGNRLIVEKMRYEKETTN
jgi:hypothetical protein